MSWQITLLLSVIIICATIILYRMLTVIERDRQRTNHGLMGKPSSGGDVATKEYVEKW